MAFLKQASLKVEQAQITLDGWNVYTTPFKVRTAAANDVIDFKKIIADFNPSDYLLTHCTIVASVDVEDCPECEVHFASEKTKKDFGKLIGRKDFYITPDTSKYVNHNGDAWTRELLKTSYKTFIGAENYVEHVQDPKFSKGKILDAVLREVDGGKSLFTDILVATNRKHTDLVNKISSGQLNTLSMGSIVGFTICTKCGRVASDETELCFPQGTRILTSNGNIKDIIDIKENDNVITHQGNIKKVIKTFERNYLGDLIELDIMGLGKIQATPNHPFYVLTQPKYCSCGCGEILLRNSVVHKRKSFKALFKRFINGHICRILPRNQFVKIDTERYNKIFAPYFEFKRADELTINDYVVMPKLKGEISSEHATIEKAKLIGYFLAEGSFIKNKEGEKTGILFSLNPHDEMDTLAIEISNLLKYIFPNETKGISYNLDYKNFITEDTKIIGDINIFEKCPRCYAPEKYIENKNSEYYKCSLCKTMYKKNLDRILKPIIDKERGTVTFNSKKASEFFYHFCNEYSEQKYLSEDVLLWPIEIQKNILASWFKGDGTLSKTLKGSTVSFYLWNQLFVIGLRCGLHINKSIVYDKKSYFYEELPKDSLGNILRDSYGELPRLELKVYREHSQILLDINAMGKLPEVSFSINKLKGVGENFVYPIKSIKKIPFSGKVYNFEVEDDNSYIANDMSVHNCNHIKLLKRNNFISSNDGKKRIIAELCSHFLYPDSNKFIEGSWVENPAFVGAVKRNEINIEAMSDEDKKAFTEKYAPIIASKSSVKETTRKIIAAFNLVNKFKKVLKTAKTEEDLGIDLPDPADLPAPGTDTPEPEAPKEDVNLDTAPTGLEETPLDKEVDLEEASKKPYDTIKKDLKTKLIQDLKKELLDEFGVDVTKERLKTFDDVNENDNLVKSNFKDLTKISMIIKESGLKELIKRGVSRSDTLKIAYLTNKYSINLDIYKIVEGMNLNEYPTFRKFSKGVESKLGREITIAEKITLKRLIEDIDGKGSI